MVVLLFALFVLELILGTVDIDLIKGFTEFNSIDGNILESRIIRASMSVLVGASCGLAGLGIQTLFKNPNSSWKTWIKRIFSNTKTCRGSYVSLSTF